MSAPQSAPSEPVLSVRDLTVEFRTRRGSLTALDGISLQISKGEVLGVVGESGAGKSVTGAAVIGLLAGGGRITGGEIRLSGLRIDNLPERQMRPIRGKRIGMVFQDPSVSLDPLLTIGDQLTETIRVHLNVDAAGARRRAVELLEETGIANAEQRLSSYPHEFSGGMRQRVVIALALAGEPELVIADEPTTALDVSVQAQILELLRKLCRERRTALLLITHDMGVIARMADRVAVMYAGRVVEVGPVDEVVRRPRHPYARGLMAAIPPLTHRPERLVQIPGSMPRLSAIPVGCAFHPRCEASFGPCERSRPSLRRDGPVDVACHLFDADAAR
ncbi:methionine ABC transporter ATP-binding protein [Acuticoccus sediminis]|uniref:Methionine ABC transporter ATP-binding protein n=1 Tax=Acuticoccus sediminis TaxID=2184697 RepID=A0A8B2NKS8_9HYPH|nr:ABC transporter ATP-binding protein [Acuticoccus sediminis]RAI00106.1 methionine ABC transporter ATP-binding protein [Acuticoccus sediminis]